MEAETHSRDTDEERGRQRSETNKQTEAIERERERGAMTKIRQFNRTRLDSHKTRLDNHKPRQTQTQAKTQAKTKYTKTQAKTNTNTSQDKQNLVLHFLGKSVHRTRDCIFFSLIQNSSLILSYFI